VESDPHLITRGGQPTHRRIFEGLRDQIRNGRYVPGTQLPGTRELAVDWQTSIFTVHTALRALAKEGWIDRRPNAGTYIADPRQRFLCAGIYHASDIGSVKSSAFTRYLHFALMERLEKLNKSTEVFNDTRPEESQGRLFGPLADALAQKRIQCLIAPCINSEDAASLAKLTQPVAFVSNPFSKSRIDFNREMFLRESARRLAAQGCRSVGILSNIRLPLDQDDAYLDFYPSLRRIIEKEGLTMRDEWIRRPIDPQFDLAGFGYREMKALWELPERPDGLIITTDSVAEGAVIAILELGIGVVPAQMKFVFHRNAHLPFLCPFPVTWGISDEDKLADGLIDLIQKQFAGAPIEPAFLDYDFSYGSCVTARL
jgi:DNA-binding LacI/PurR family transcriptional regulator